MPTKGFWNREVRKRNSKKKREFLNGLKIFMICEISGYDKCVAALGSVLI
jgi:hypothetical protein